MTHTPGPWKIASTVSAHYIESEGCEVARVDLIGAPEVRVLEDAANARLIASAPELLEACEVANQFFEENDDFTDGEYPIPGFILDMRIAIKKATGRCREEA